MERSEPVRAEGEKRWLVPAALLTVYLVWGSTYFAIGRALESYPPFLMASARFVVAGSLLLGVLRLRGAPRITARQWRSAAIVGLLLLAGGNGGVVYAQQSVASGLAAVLVASVSLWSALFGGLFGTWPTLRQWLGVAVGLVGLVLLNLGGDLRGNSVGVAALLFAAMSWAFGSVWSRKLDLPEGALSSAAHMICGGLALLVLALLHGEQLPRHVTLSATLALGYLVVFGSLLGFSAYVFLIRHTSPALSTSYAYVNPVVAVLLGVTLGAERIGLGTVGALAVILSGVALVALPSRWRATRR